MFSIQFYFEVIKDNFILNYYRANVINSQKVLLSEDHCTISHLLPPQGVYVC